MIYKLQSSNEYARYIAGGVPLVSGSTPNVNEAVFDNETGILHVKADGTKRFLLAVPVSGLRIGDIVHVECLYKHISGAEPTLNNTIVLNPLSNTTGSEGKRGQHRMQISPNTAIRDFQKIELRFVYEGLNAEGGVSFTNNATGEVFVRLLLETGYGVGEFLIRDFTIKTEHPTDGLCPATRVYRGVLQYDVLTKVWGFQNNGTPNIHNLTITESEGIFININFDKRFKVGATVFLNTSYQRAGNARKYEIMENTTTSLLTRLIVIDTESNQPVNLADINRSIYCNFILVGE